MRFDVAVLMIYPPEFRRDISCRFGMILSQSRQIQGDKQNVVLKFKRFTIDIFRFCCIYYCSSTARARQEKNTYQDFIPDLGSRFSDHRSIIILVVHFWYIISPEYTKYFVQHSFFFFFQQLVVHKCFLSRVKSR